MNDGILLVDKPAGCTSADVVRAVKRRHRPQSIGHLGTLDPMATGLLPLCIDGGTRIAQFLGAESKAYTGSIRLGIETDTLDVTGAVIGRQPVPVASESDLGAVAEGFLGDSAQVPPMYSAIKQDGRRLYEMAREGKTVERRPRAIHIERLVLCRGADPDEVLFEVRCSKGTYVRVLAADVGRALGTSACLASLRRTEFGGFRLEEAIALEELLDRSPGDLPVLAPRSALRGAQELLVDARAAFGLAAGQRQVLERLPRPAGSGALGAAIAPNGRLLAVLQPEGEGWKLRRVVMPEASELYRA